MTKITTTITIKTTNKTLRQKNPARAFAGADAFFKFPFPLFSLQFRERSRPNFLSCYLSVLLNSASLPIILFPES